MGIVRQLAIAIERELREPRSTLRQTVATKVATAEAAILETQTSDTVELANRLPLERQDMRERWRRRLLKNPLLSSSKTEVPTDPNHQWFGQFFNYSSPIQVVEFLNTILIY